MTVTVQMAKQSSLVFIGASQHSKLHVSPAEPEYLKLGARRATEANAKQSQLPGKRPNRRSESKLTLDRTFDENRNSLPCSRFNQQRNSVVLKCVVGFRPEVSAERT